MGYGDKVGIIAYNRREWMEIYVACAKGGQIAVPILFRLTPLEYEYIINITECKAFIVEKPFVEGVNSVRQQLNTIPANNYIFLGEGETPKGYTNYEDLLNKSNPSEPDVIVDSKDPWRIMFTSGTTGKPKGVVHTHENSLGEWFVNTINLGVRPTDKPLLVMPLAHVNSIAFSFPYTIVGAPIMVYNMVSFDPEDLLRTIEKYNITFVSLVPTQYVMILELPEEVKQKYDTSSIRQLFISSAPARSELKVAIMEYFSNAELWEGYGSTEIGTSTLLRPEDQFRKLSSIGREARGTDRIKLLDEQGNEVPDGEVGELYVRSPGAFKEYWKDPERTREVFNGEWITVRDAAKRDADGYYYLIGRKQNMIITGGENVYPSEVEDVVKSHPAVKEVAVIGSEDKKWGEMITAVIILKQDYQPSDKLAEEIMDHCKGKIAGYKRPRIIKFINEADMPRTATGKIVYGTLKEKYGRKSSKN